METTSLGANGATEEAEDVNADNSATDLRRTSEAVAVDDDDEEVERGRKGCWEMNLGNAPSGYNRGEEEDDEDENGDDEGEEEKKTCDGVRKKTDKDSVGDAAGGSPDVRRAPDDDNCSGRGMVAPTSSIRALAAGEGNGETAGEATSSDEVRDGAAKDGAARDDAEDVGAAAAAAFADVDAAVKKADVGQHWKTTTRRKRRGTETPDAAAAVAAAAEARQWER